MSAQERQLVSAQERQLVDPSAAAELAHLTQGSSHHIHKVGETVSPTSSEQPGEGSHYIIFGIHGKVRLAQNRRPEHNIVTHLLSPYYVPISELDALSSKSPCLET